MKKFLLGVTAVVLVFALATSVWAEPKDDNFWVGMSPDNIVVMGGGSGWNANGNPSGGEGQWIYYPETNWWNQWFYDDPPDPKRWKEISYDVFILAPGVGFPPFVEVALNWSNLDFPASGPNGPPPLPDQERYIERAVIFSGEIDHNYQLVRGEYVIPNYNPEWVSIDVRYNNPQGGDFGYILGSIRHECVPEPSTLVLLGFGAMGLLAWVWRRRS